MSAVETTVHAVNQIAIDGEERFYFELRHGASRKRLSVYVGQPEAFEIARLIDPHWRNTAALPGLFCAAIEATGSRIVSANITGLVGGAYTASLTIGNATSTINLTARPSDIAAISLAAGIPVLVEDELLV